MSAAAAGGYHKQQVPVRDNEAGKAQHELKKVGGG
jgi:hypothetical protein